MKSYADSTLQSMKKDDLIAIIRCLEYNISVKEEQNQNQFNLLMQEDLRKERYKWHDIRKNKDDMPNENGKKIVCDNLGYISMRFFTNGHFLGGYDDLMAWREIEPYEEV